MADVGVRYVVVARYCNAAVHVPSRDVIVVGAKTVGQCTDRCRRGGLFRLWDDFECGSVPELNVVSARRSEQLHAAVLFPCAAAFLPSVSKDRRAKQWTGCSLPSTFRGASMSLQGAGKCIGRADVLRGQHHSGAMLEST